MTAGRPGELALLDLVVREGRGPRRNAVFAGWLILRAAVDHQKRSLVTERNQTQRLSAIRKRLGSLTLPDQLRKNLYDIIEKLATADRTGVQDLLVELKIVLRNAVSPAAGDAVQLAIDAGADTINSAPTL